MQTNDKIRPYVLTIAGFDGSSGAGITADIKTMEHIGVYGLSVCTALTVQHESVFQEVRWVEPDLIKQQIILL
ncbi:bifunctional hydroxymethylpyrimidine kinase/phosphomethylpyrimidine kinase, partial [Aureispira]|nr:bifunctional hydroxymethylpyrimidine kinase/phosphomethylpyrimidine kinase [Aureispira sp.]